MVKLNRIGVIKAACFLGLFGVFVGLIFSMIILIFKSILFNAIDDLISGWLVIVALPFVYGILGFLSGLIFVSLMNLVLRIVKGLDLDMVE